MKSKNPAETFQDSIFKYLGITKKELEARINEQEVDCTDECEYEADQEDTSVDECEINRIEVLGNVIDNVLVNLEVGNIHVENAEELRATIKAVSEYENLKKYFE